ncbi:hypothetical protein GC176_12800 [bacterium]|nr:hypothetical protein [bacterium]
MAVSSPVCPVCSGTNLSFQNIYGPSEYKAVAQRAFSQIERWERVLYDQLANASAKVDEKLAEIETDAAARIARLKASEPELISTAAEQRTRSDEDRAVTFLNGEDEDDVLAARVKDDIGRECDAIRQDAQNRVQAVRKKALAFRQDVGSDFDELVEAQSDHVVSVVFCVNCGHVIGTVSSPHTSRLAFDRLLERVCSEIESVTSDLCEAVLQMSSELTVESRLTREEAQKATLAAKEVSATIRSVYSEVMKTARLVNLGFGINNAVSGYEGQ